MNSKLATTATIPTSDVIFRDDLYPRIRTSAETVQKYAEDLSVLPPIEVNQRNELIDGWHRWTAHRKNEVAEIAVVVTDTKSDNELLELAIERNAKFGLQLSQADKKAMAKRIYNSTPDRERKAKKEHLRVLLSVDDRTIRSWTSRIDKDAKEERNQRIFELWLACQTLESIAAEAAVTAETTKQVVFQKTENQPESEKPAASHLTDFDTPIYNVWKWQDKSEGSGHFGNTESTIVDRLLYLYTDPFDIVVDPFAGGGSTIDICRKRFRRYFVSDRKPIVEREKEIRQHDLAAIRYRQDPGLSRSSDTHKVVRVDLPKPPQWKDVKLVYLDPPYWKQSEGKYSEDPTDLANMDLDEFTKTLAGIVQAFAKKVSDAYIALIIQPTQWKAPEKQFTDHVADLIRAVKLPIDMRISCPYESQQCTAQMVEWAKANKKLLVLNRELLVWRV